MSAHWSANPAYALFGTRFAVMFTSGHTVEFESRRPIERRRALRRGKALARIHGADDAVAMRVIAPAANETAWLPEHLFIP